MANLWFFYALGASMLWGFGYVLSEKLLQYGLSPAFIMFTTYVLSVPMFAMLVLKSGGFQINLDLITADKVIFIIALMLAVTLVFGNLFILEGIALKNATLVATIEATYPIFTAILAYFILKEVQINWWTFAGAILCCCGVCIIYLKS